MKKLLSLLCLLLTVCICLGAFTACAGADTDKNQPSNQLLTVTDDFIITRPQNATDAEKRSANNIFFAFNKLGMNLLVQDDSVEEPKNEILIGQTARQASQDAIAELDTRDYTVQLTGSEKDGYKIVIAAISEDSLEAAVEYFVEKYVSVESAGKLPLDLLYNYKFEYVCKDVQINGTPIADYKIVYAAEGVTSKTDPHYGTFVQTAKYEDTANAIADRIELATSHRPEVLPDTAEIAAGTPVILFGKTALAADDFAYTSAFSETGAYIGKLNSDGTVVLAGDNACAVYAAGEAFLNALAEAKTNLTAFDVAATKELIKVACIGDSITHGTSSSDSSVYNYPVYLQRMLGYDYYVEKYGAPGYSLTRTDTYQYMSYSIYNWSVEAKPDVVIIMLGTNDCNPGDDYKDWTNPNRATTFKDSAATMINAYRRSNSDVQIYMMTPPTVPSSEAWSASIEANAVPLVKEIAQSQNCLLIDIYQWSLTHKSTFTADGGDGLHPKNEHYAELAEGVYEGLKDTIVKP